MTAGDQDSTHPDELDDVEIPTQAVLEIISTETVATKRLAELICDRLQPQWRDLRLDDLRTPDKLAGMIVPIVVADFIERDRQWRRTIRNAKRQAAQTEINARHQARSAEASAQRQAEEEKRVERERRRESWLWSDERPNRYSI